MAKLKTLDIVPALEGRRFSVTELGSMAATTVREEHALMRGAIAKLLGLPPDEVTTEHVQALYKRELREAVAR